MAPSVGDMNPINPAEEKTMNTTGTTTSTATTNDSDDAGTSVLTLTASTASVTEGGSITYTATVNNAVTGSPLVVTLSNGQTITIPVGASSANSAAFAVRADDAYVQGTQAVTVGISGTTGGNFEALTTTEGDVWLAGGADDATYGLWHSTDSGASFTRLAGVDKADSIGFGKPATGSSYPALYTSAQIGGVRGIFRSDTAGATWVRINDGNHQWGWTGAAITGDPRVYGRVYVSTNGRGIIVLPSQAANGRSRIVAQLSGPATLPASVADFVVTEHGIAALRDRSLDERRSALIAIADPTHRRELAA